MRAPLVELDDEPYVQTSNDEHNPNRPLNFIYLNFFFNRKFIQIESTIGGNIQIKVSKDFTLKKEKKYCRVTHND